VAVHQAIAGAGYPSENIDGLAWIDAVLEHCADDQVRNLVRELSVDPLPADAGQDVRYATSVIARLLELDASRRIEELKGRLQRTDDDPEAATEVMRDLMALEDYRRSLRANATGQTT
jgi:DNA primase